MSYFTKEELRKLKIEERLKKHPIPWSAEYKCPRWKGGKIAPTSFYIIKNANGDQVTQVLDPQDAHKLLKLVNGEANG